MDSRKESKEIYTCVRVERNGQHVFICLIIPKCLDVAPAFTGKLQVVTDGLERSKWRSRLGGVNGYHT